jgi:hypothetical protein
LRGEVRNEVRNEVRSEVRDEVRSRIREVRGRRGLRSGAEKGVDGEVLIERFARYRVVRRMVR